MVNFFCSGGYDFGKQKSKHIHSTTTEVNLTTGYIIGTDITIASFIPGTIKFTVNKPIESDKTWAGVTNNIEFKGKINGQTSITYTVE